MRKENNQIYFVWNSKPAFSLDIIKCLIAYNQDGVCSLRGTNYIIFSLKINWYINYIDASKLMSRI